MLLVTTELCMCVDSANLILFDFLGPRVVQYFSMWKNFLSQIILLFYFLAQTRTVHIRNKELLNWQLQGLCGSWLINT